ncbi:hypothetical protein AB205_0091760, partial [Aquarana catesbeiana]
PEVEDGRASIYESVVTNTSKEMMCYSDFPIPEGYPNFLHNTKMMEYYKQYAERFSLLKYIQFNTLVCSVKKHPNFSRTGQWEVTTEKDGKKETSIFDAVMVCNGHHTDPYYPLESFPAKVKLKRLCFVLTLKYINKNVKVKRSQSKVYLSTRRGCWVMSRVFDQGYPCDICFDTRFQTLLRNTLPTPIVTWLTEKKMNEWFDHAHYGLQPRDSTQFKEPLFNDELPSRIICGYVIVKPNLTEFTETSVKFNDGTIEENIDVVVFATGYRYSFPFLDESILKVENKIFLYKSVFPKNLEKATLGVVGLIQPLGPIMAASEMQARWITRVFKGLCKFPSQDEIQKDIELKQKILLTRYAFILSGFRVNLNLNCSLKKVK